MLGPVDAIKYYSQLVASLNDAVAKEQVSAYRLALKEDRFSGTTAINVIEEFLAVTEIGSIRRLLKEKSGSSRKWMKSRANSSKNIGNGDYGSVSDNNTDTNLETSSSYLAYQTNEYGVVVPVDNMETINDTPEITKEFDLISTDENGHSIQPNIRFPFIFYKMTYAEWLYKLWTSPTFSDAWRVFKDGREGERHNTNSQTANGKPEEHIALIAPPEERKMFLSKAFVTFKTFAAATIARQVIHMQLAGHLAVSEAPEPTDIVW
eukprot:CAMPEP_0196766248 /NCGR_PEP_ID=MMETSP1095-20130614/20987_1 /TAXON_ID=96789 ORGANISM="Chromulina nebulosa, Strain UTEXLB2642" /NCGR_SAMPLE_ID=MMETSP1095 /ASSEMBLY_ACC=CAM_ASM_000446 /LENGTH=263 /DNA_ID=CAMNT_0042127115 /DNA_START=782 /DNA_END=1570 /DNA_ORIENTATION=+